MSAKFYTLLTDIGAAKLASAAALGVPLKITKMAVGDGGGALPTPNAQQTALVGEKRRADLNMLYIDPQNSSQIIAEQVIPETEGGWWIREVGLFDETGALIAIGNCPESYKPQLVEGSGRTQTVRMVMITSSTENITLKIDPSVVLATRKYVDDKVLELELELELELKVYVDDQMAKHAVADNPHPQYALLSAVTGVTGNVLNAKMQVSSEIKTASFSADEIVVSAKDAQFRICGFNKSINLNLTGVGGMDTGAPPNNGYVGIYVIYNPSTQVSALLGVNGQSLLAETYQGVALPTGFTASALVSVWGINASGSFTIGYQRGRTIRTPQLTILSSSAAPGSPTPLNISAAVPKNAKTCMVYTRSRAISGAGSMGFALSIDAGGVGRTAGGVYIGSGSQDISYDSAAMPLQMSSPQVIYYYLTVYAITSYNFFIYCSGYEI